MRMANLAVRFVLELACLAALVYWGAGATSSGAANVAIAILAPLAAAILFVVAIVNATVLGRTEVAAD
jgi:hypothetical protein